MTKPSKLRDSSGKFICDSTTPSEEQVVIQNWNLWRRMRFFISMMVVLILSLPWGMIMIEPAKNYSFAIGEGVSNFTTSLKDNFCSCPIQAVKPSM